MTIVVWSDDDGRFIRSTVGREGEGEVLVIWFGIWMVIGCSLNRDADILDIGVPVLRDGRRAADRGRIGVSGRIWVGFGLFWISFLVEIAQIGHICEISGFWRK